MAVVTRAEIVSINEYGEDIKEFIIKPDKYKRVDAGTFLQLALEDVTASDYWPESRTFSIASYYNSDKTMRLIIKKVGKFTGRIFSELKQGTCITIKYPYGDFLLPAFDNEGPIVCIAGGTGIAPFLSFIESLEKEGGIERLMLFYSARKYEDFFSIEYLKKTISKDKLKLYLTREKKDGIENRRIATADIPKIDNGHYYICGSQEFISYFKRSLENEGLKNIYIDEWE